MDRDDLFMELGAAEATLGGLRAQVRTNWVAAQIDAYEDHVSELKEVLGVVD